MVCDENASKWNAPKWNRAKVGHVKLARAKLARAKLNAPKWHVIMRCSASGMFAESNVDSCQAQIRRSIHSLRNRLDVSLNVIARSVVNSDVHITSSLHHTWIRTLYTILL